jgi:hypothetical protein
MAGGGDDSFSREVPMTSPMTGDGDRVVNADSHRPVGRVRFMDAQRVNLDGFAREEPGLGLVALRSPADPEPGLAISGGRVTEMDGVPEANFDAIDAYIARHGLDLQVAGEAMGLSEVEFARRPVSPDVPKGGNRAAVGRRHPRQAGPGARPAPARRARPGHDQAAGPAHPEQPGARHQPAR